MSPGRGSSTRPAALKAGLPSAEDVSGGRLAPALTEARGPVSEQSADRGSGGAGRGSGLPSRVRLLVLAVVAAGVAGVALRVPELLRWRGREVLAFAGLSVAIAIVELFPLPLRYRTEILYLSLTDALWAAALLLAPPGVLTLAVATGAVVGQALRRRAPVKIAYNAGQFVFAVTVAELVFHAIHSGPALNASAWIAGVLGMAVCFLINASATALVISLIEGKPFPRVLQAPLGPNVMHWAGNVAMGFVGALMWQLAPQALLLQVVPLVLSYSAYRAWLQGMQERDRMRNLYDAGQSLSGPLNAPMDYRPFLRLVEQMLDTDAVELVVADGSQVVVHGVDGSTALHRTRRAQQNLAIPEAFVSARPGIPLHVASVGAPEGVRGALAVYREPALSAPERSIVDTLASQVSVRLENRRLFVETLEQQTQLAEIIAHSSDGIFVVARDRTIQSWNPAMHAITGFRTEEAMGRTWEEVFGSEAGGEGPAGNGGGSAQERDILFASKDGQARWIRYSRTPIRDEDGSKGDVVVARDVTTELEAEQLKADFVATVSHELRTPLTPLKGFLSTLLSGNAEGSHEARREYYEIMMKQVSRLERLITDLLEVSRIESGKVPVEAHTVDLIALVSEQITEFESHEGDGRVVLHAPTSQVLVHADPFRVGQVVSNLVSNAVKYSPDESRVEVTLSTAGNQAIVAVRDEGDGIPASEQERVFDRFHRVEGGLTRRTGGTGLGLYIAKRLVEAMSGRLWLVSRPEEGSTFSFSLPLAASSWSFGPEPETNGRHAGVAELNRA